MKILIAPDKFKHSLSSAEACNAINEGLSKKIFDLQTTLLPMADGGDGLLDILSFYTSSRKISIDVFDPFFRKISSHYLISEDGKTAFIEMAKASGLMLLKPEEYNVELTSTYGTGELIRDAIQKGVSKIVLGIGGSATNDAGIGMAAALGYRFLDVYKNELSPIGKNLEHIAFIEKSEVIDFRHVHFEVACDVTNPLTGENGAAKVYSPQKGADDDMVDRLESGMLHFSALIKSIFGMDVNTIAGGGAAGGLGAGTLIFLNATLRSGIELVFEYSKAEMHIQNADLMISGEGKLDEQSLQGKVVSGLASLCKKYNKRLIVFCGKLELSNDLLEGSGIEAAYSINPEGISEDEAFKNAYSLLREKVEEQATDLCG